LYFKTILVEGKLMTTEINIKYRTWMHGIPPKRIKLQIPGWAGENTWEIPQPWQCKPWSDCATYGLELIYTWKNPCIVTGDEKGKAHFDMKFDEGEIPDYLEKDWHPFAAFAPGHYGYVANVDIKTPDGYSLMLQPHPRAFSDRTGEVPIAVQGMLEMDWWPEIFFMVFKTPLKGQKHIFRNGDPICSCFIVPKDINYNIEEMSEQEDEDRNRRQATLEDKWYKMCTRVFYCKDDEEFFDNKYKVMSEIAGREGNDKVNYYLDNPRKLPHWNKEPLVKDFRVPNPNNIQHHIQEDSIKYPSRKEKSKLLMYLENLDYGVKKSVKV
jgi:hypothetical protein